MTQESSALLPGDKPQDSRSTILQPGHKLQGRYEIEALISGVVNLSIGGRVYRARTLGPFTRRVAIKQLLSELVFDHEARILSRIKHASVPFLIDAFIEMPCMYLVMEFIEGDTLLDKVQDRKARYSLRTKLDWAISLLDVLDYLHRKTFVHRDIKPENAKVSATDDSVVVILDFGTAKLNSATLTALIGTGTFVYMSPEQHTLQDTEPRSDIYSFSATFYFVLTGHEPSDAAARLHSIANQGVDSLIPMRSHDDTIPKEVERIFKEGMSLDIDGRPPSTAAMRDQLIVERDKLPPELIITQDAIIHERYRRGRRLNKASLGVLYEAFDESANGQGVHMLHVPLAMYVDDPVLAALLKDRRQLQHPAIPRLLDSFEIEADLPYPGTFLIFEPVYGNALGSYHIPIDKEGERESIIGGLAAVVRVTHWLQNTLNTLVDLHEHTPSTIIGDLSSETIYYNNDDTTTIMYWGPTAQPSHDTPTLSQTTLSPEAFERNELNPQSDVFALGGTFYGVYSGDVLPYDAQQRKIIIARGQADPLEPLTKWNRHVPPLLSDILMRTMALDPKERYPDARAVQQALAPIFAAQALQEEVKAHPYHEKLIVYADRITPSVREQYREYQKLVESTPWPYPVDRVLCIVEDVLDALACLHAATKSTHGLISLDTVLVDPKDNVCLLVDVCRTTSEQKQRFITPEHLKKAVIPASDLFALAALAYHLLRGEAPYVGLRLETQADGQPDPLRPVTNWNPKVPALFNDILIKAMALLPEDRYASATEMRRALEPLVEARRIRMVVEASAYATRLHVYAQYTEDIGAAGLLRNESIQGFTIGRVVQIITDIADALDLLHFSAGKVHGRVSPTTIQMDEQGRAQLRVNSLRQLQSLEVQFAGPEQWNNAPLEPSDRVMQGATLGAERVRRVATEASDRCSLAIVAYYLLTRQLPPMPTADMDIPQFARRIVPDLSAVFIKHKGIFPPKRITVDHIAMQIAKGMAWKPELRFTSCEAFASALDNALRQDRILTT